MSAEGMTSTVLATQLAKAVANDETPEAGGCDLSAGVYGPSARAWLRDVAEAFDDEYKYDLTELGSPFKGLGAWLPIETAPKNGLILLAVEGAAGERRTFAAEASHEGGGWVWMSTTGWGGWKRLHGAWAPIFWQPLPQTPNLNSTTAPSYNSRVVLASR